MKLFLLIIAIIPILTFGQINPKQIDEFIHKSIIIKNDTINYHLFSNDKLENINKVLLFFQGSGPKPLYEKGTLIDTLKVLINGETKNEIKKSTWLGTTVPIDLKKIPENYAIVIISKKGVPFLDIDQKFKPNELYYNNEGLNYRVWQGDKVINDLRKKLFKKLTKIVILGHSEGSDVVAKLGHINKNVTHVGYWAGGANSQYYEYALMLQKSVLQNEFSQEESIIKLDSLFQQIKNIQIEPKNIDKKWWGNSYRRWAEFTEPPIDNLLKITKLLFVAVGAKDQSVPFESSLLIPIEFIRNSKTNLTFKMYPNYDHSFSLPPKTKGEKKTKEFMKVFDEFMKWTNEN